jgi:hypothetical protein
MEFKNRSTNYVEKVIAIVAHARIPDLRIGLPGVMSELVWIINHAPIFTTKKK